MITARRCRQSVGAGQLHRDLANPSLSSRTEAPSTTASISASSIRARVTWPASTSAMARRKTPLEAAASKVASSSPA